MYIDVDRHKQISRKSGIKLANKELMKRVSRYVS